MSRWPRQVNAGSLQHVISQFVDRKFWLADDRDRQCYLDSMDRYAPEWDWQILSFALMSSHVHHGPIAGNDSLAKFFHPVHTRYARYWHRRYGGLGPVFAERPANFTFNVAEAPRLIVYHHQNPVKAKAAPAAEGFHVDKSPVLPAS